MRASRLHRALFLLTAMTLAGCGAPTDTGTITDHDPAKQRWTSGRPVSYDYTVSLSCFCTQDVTRAVVVVVDGARVVSRSYADNGAAVPERWASTFPSVDGLFATIESAIAAHAATVDVTYDAALGYPTRIALDYRVEVADDESTYTIRDFHVRASH